MVICFITISYAPISINVKEEVKRIEMRDLRIRTKYKPSFWDRNAFQDNRDFFEKLKWFLNWSSGFVK